MLLRHPLRFSYSLRALLVFITLFCLWGGYHGNRAIKERRAVEFLQRQGAHVSVVSDYRGYKPMEAVATRYRQFSQALWGEPCISAVNVCSELEPELVEAFSQLPYLEVLTLRSQVDHKRDLFLVPPVGAIGQVLKQSQLRHLKFEHWMLSDDDIQNISKQPNLDTLTFDRVSFSEESFAVLFTLPSLRQLIVKNCQIKGERLDKAVASTSLQSLNCENVPVGLGFAEYIGRLPHIEGLALSGPTVDDTFIDMIGPHQTLSVLDFSRTAITSHSIPLLLRMPALRSVRVPSAIQLDSIADSLQTDFDGVIFHH